jgi:hypothetical protein
MNVMVLEISLGVDQMQTFRAVSVILEVLQCRGLIARSSVDRVWKGSRSLTTQRHWWILPTFDRSRAAGRSPLVRA